MKGFDSSTRLKIVTEGNKLKIESLGSKLATSTNVQDAACSSIFILFTDPA